MRPRDQAPPQGHRHRKMPPPGGASHAATEHPGSRWRGPLERHRLRMRRLRLRWQATARRVRTHGTQPVYDTETRNCDTQNKHEAEKFAFTPSTRPVHNAPVRRQPGDEVMRLSFDLRPIDSPQELLLTCPLFFAITVKSRHFLNSVSHIVSRQSWSWHGPRSPSPQPQRGRRD